LDQERESSALQLPTAAGVGPQRQGCQPQPGVLVFSASKPWLVQELQWHGSHAEITIEEGHWHEKLKDA
jgi:hypothetical protein